MILTLLTLVGLAWAQLPPGFPGPPPSKYMVDNTGNTFGVAPDKANFTGSVTIPHNETLTLGYMNGSAPVTFARRHIHEHVHAHAHAHVHDSSVYEENYRGVVRRGSGYWLEYLAGQALSPQSPQEWIVFRNVKAYGAKGDGISDDTWAINLAITDREPCGSTSCSQTSNRFSVIYFPAGTYLISSPIIQCFVGDPKDRPVLKGSSDFQGIAIIDTDPYIPEGNGDEWYVNQNQFYRQVRNFVIDMTYMSDKNYQGGQEYTPTGIHWQVAQATSLQNIEFNMPKSGSTATTAVGIFMENGSGGFVSDLVFNYGNIGFRAGSQQFTARNLQFNYCLTGVSMIWNWGFVWKDITMSNVIDGQGTGSLTIIDSHFYNVPYAIPLTTGSTPPTIYLDNLVVSGEYSKQVVFYSGHADSILEVTPGSTTTINGWAMGNRLQGSDTTVSNTHGYVDPVPTRSASLNNADGSLFARSKPQYEDVAAADIVDVLGNDIVNDGSRDNTDAINSLLQAAVGKVIFFPAGIYTVEGTVFVPAGSKIIGSAWSQIQAAGAYFEDASNPQPVVRVGNDGDVGSVEISDMLFTVTGSTAGAILMEWNIHEDTQGSAAMWDAHFRVGGAKGTNLQLEQCAASSPVNTSCIAAAMLFHMTPRSSGYFENVWMWTADHDLDAPNGLSAAASQISIVSTRGALIESQGPTWFYGSAVEHNALYQYELYGANDIFLGHMQTETPYWQPTPTADALSTSDTLLASDPTFAHCATDDSACREAYALRIVDSTNIYIYGAGLYSFFSTYSEDCLADESCQTTLLETNFAEGIWIMNLFTKGATQAASPLGGIPAIYQKDCQVGFTTELSIWSTLGLSGSDIGDSDELSDIDTSVYVWDCDNADNYPDLDAIAADGSIPVVCHNFYIVSVMARNLTASLQAYSDLMANGYEEKYKYYSEAIQNIAPKNWNKFYENEYDDLVTCTWTVDGANKTDGCPPNHQPDYSRGASSSNLYTTVDDMTAFLNVTESAYGIEPDWIDFDAYTSYAAFCQVPGGRNGPVTTCPTSEQPKRYEPALAENFVVDDPAKSLLTSLSNYQSISTWLNGVVLDMSLGLFVEDDADVIDALDTVVYSVDAALASMQQVYDIGTQAEAAAEEERKDLILLFVSAFLLVVPGLGEELDLIADASIFARMGSLIGDVGDAALTLYGVYEDPNSAPLAIAGLLIGGALRGDESVLRDAAALRRATSDDTIAALGVRTANNLKKLAPIRARCDV
ncbi:hypothetical protein MBLNU459_g7342t1 [Dothideomycetes sp. NU459]